MSDYDYNEYYQEKDYFGKACTGLLDFFEKSPRSSLLDLGAGQGRDSIPLSKMGYAVTSVDVSQVGIQQIQQKDDRIIALVGDLYLFDVSTYDYILMDSILHFEEDDRKKEMALVTRILTDMKQGSIFVNCSIKCEDSEKILKSIMEGFAPEIIYDDYIKYHVGDEIYYYHMIAVKKQYACFRL